MKNLGRSWNDIKVMLCITTFDLYTQASPELGTYCNYIHIFCMSLLWYPDATCESVSMV